MRKIIFIPIILFVMNLSAQSLTLAHSKDTCFLVEMVDTVMTEWVIVADKKGTLKKIRPLWIIYIYKKKECNAIYSHPSDVYDRKFFVMGKQADVIAYKDAYGNLSVF